MQKAKKEEKKHVDRSYKIYNAYFKILTIYIYIYWQAKNIFKDFKKKNKLFKNYN